MTHEQKSRLGGLAAHPTNLARDNYAKLGYYNHLCGQRRYALALLELDSIFYSSDALSVLTKRQWDRCRHSDLVIQLGPFLWKRDECKINNILRRTQGL